jgi:hypothetical protein
MMSSRHASSSSSRVTRGSPPNSCGPAIVITPVPPDGWLATTAPHAHTTNHLPDGADNGSLGAAAQLLAPLACLPGGRPRILRVPAGAGCFGEQMLPDLAPFLRCLILLCPRLHRVRLLSAAAPWPRGQRVGASWCGDVCPPEPRDNPGPEDRAGASEPVFGAKSKRPRVGPVCIFARAARGS